MRLEMTVAKAARMSHLNWFSEVKITRGRPSMSSTGREKSEMVKRIG